MPRHPKKISTQLIFPCPVQGCRTQVRSCWGFTQHVRANHPASGMDLQYLGLENEVKFVQPPSSDVDQSSSPPLSPHTHFQVSDQGPSDFDSDSNAGLIPVDLDPLESDLGDGRSVLADSTEFHPLINGMYINCVILQLLNE